MSNIIRVIFCTAGNLVLLEKPSSALSRHESSPVFKANPMKELKDILAGFRELKSPAALATIVGTKGSSYRRTGARLLALPSGGWIGTLSGGCIEEEISLRAAEVMRGGAPVTIQVDTLLRYGCPGLLEIFIERIEPRNRFLTALQTCIASRRTADVVVLHEESRPARGSHMADDAPETGGLRQRIQPAIRVVITGGGTDTDTLAGFCGILGWEVAVIETAEEIDAYADMRTALVVKNHHFGRDVAALARGFSSPFGYIGLLSSRKRKRKILEVLDEEYLQGDIASRENFHGPAGLDIGGESPEEVALSIVSEIQAVMTGHDAGFLSDRSTPIHRHSCEIATP